MSENFNDPALEKFIKSMGKKTIVMSLEHYPVHKRFICAHCSFETDHYLQGFECPLPRRPHDYKKWPVSYMCDLCKAERYFKYCPPDTKLTFVKGIRVKASRSIHPQQTVMIKKYIHE